MCKLRNAQLDLILEILFKELKLFNVKLPVGPAQDILKQWNTGQLWTVMSSYQIDCIKAKQL